MRQRGGGFGCSLWSEAVNTHPPSHKLAQLWNLQPHRPHPRDIHGRGSWGGVIICHDQGMESDWQGYGDTYWEKQAGFVDFLKAQHFLRWDFSLSDLSRIATSATRCLMCLHGGDPALPTPLAGSGRLLSVGHLPCGISSLSHGEVIFPLFCRRHSLSVPLTLSLSHIYYQRKPILSSLAYGLVCTLIRAEAFLRTLVTGLWH